MKTKRVTSISLKTVITWSACLALGLTSPALAATDGDLDTSSEGTSDIQVDIDEVVQITDIDDITVNLCAAE
jgi:hypothetical protein